MFISLCVCVCIPPYTSNHGSKPSLHHSSPTFWAPSQPLLQSPEILGEAPVQLFGWQKCRPTAPGNPSQDVSLTNHQEEVKRKLDKQVFNKENMKL